MQPFDTYSDFELVQKIAGGEVGLFEIIIRRNNSYLYKIGRAYHFNHEDTQDLMQETYIDAFIHINKFENRSAFKTWIIKIMLNNCFKKQQKWSFKHIAVAEISDQSNPMFTNQGYADTDKIVMNKELNNVIENALKQVPEDYRIVFTLREINGLSTIETSDCLNISETNVKVRLNRAKALLRKEVEKSYSTDDVFEFNLIYCDAMVERVMKKLSQLNT